MSAQKEVVIIGGGVVGLCSAYYLVKEGHKVTVLEKGDLSDSCSFGNAGMIVPSHFIPLAAPGMIAMGMKMMFKPESPFAINASLNKDLMSWGWQFYKHSTQNHVNHSKPILKSLSLLSRDLFGDLAKNGDLNFELGETGLMMLYKSDKFAEEEAHVAHQANELGITANVLNAEEVQAMEPNIKLDISGGVHYPGDAHLYPNIFIPELVRFLESQGVQVKRNTNVNGFEFSGDKIQKVKTSQGEFSGDEVIISAGMWSAPIMKQLKLKMPIQAGKGYSITLKDVEHQLRIPSILLEARVAVTPMGGDMRFAGTMEITGDDLSVNQRRVDGMLKSIPTFMPQYTTDKTKGHEIWSGLRPCSPDGLPYIGKSSSFSNLTVAAGHAMMGLSLGPASGKLVAEVVSEQKTSIDISGLHPERFN